MPEVLNSVLGVHYVFPSKELLLRAVHEDVVFERSRILQDAAGFAADLGSGMIEGARTACTKLIEPDPGQPLRQYELTVWRCAQREWQNSPAGSTSAASSC